MKGESSHVKSRTQTLKDLNKGVKKPNLRIFKEFKKVGVLPFDAMIKDNNYIVVFFKSDFFRTR